MLPILKPEDFTGVLQIADALGDITEDRFAEYITKYEEIYLRKVLGVKGYIDIRDQVTLDPKYTDFIDGVDYTDIDGDLAINKGFKSVLGQYIYYHYVAENWVNTQTGNASNINANTDSVSDGVNRQIVFNEYNYGIDIYNKDVWPFLDNYKEISNTIDSSVDNGGGSYTINLTDTTYLVDGDTVTINGIEYIVSSVVVNTSFDISGAALSLDFAGEGVIWEPFKDICKVNFKYNW